MQDNFEEVSLIKFLDLKRLNQPYENAIREAIERVLLSGWYILGEEVKRFEQEFATYCNAEYAIGVNSGLDALALILEGYQALGLLQKGDYVGVPAHTYIATWLAVSRTGLVPFPMDTDENGIILPDEKILATYQLKAVIVVHLYGLVADMALWKKLADKYRFLLIEDAAQAHGAFSNGQRVGSCADASAFSFYPVKNLGALGDAGMITTANTKLMHVVRQLQNYGSTTKYEHTIQGCNSRLDEIQAAILRAKLPYLDDENNQRKQIAERYLAHMNNPFVRLPPNPSGRVWHLFALRVKDRDNFQDFMQKNNIQTAIHYPTAVHKQIAYRKEYGHFSFPNAENLCAQTVSLPLYGALREVEIDKIIRIINNFAPKR